jgi:putative endonuclease
MLGFMMKLRSQAGENMTKAQKTGARGEKLALTFLSDKGLAIVETNWRCPQGEIDIVARDAQTLVFVEVRSRRADSTERAFASVSPLKREKMIAAAYAYLAAHDLDDNAVWRIDVVAVAFARGGKVVIDHVEDALGW